MYTRAAHAILFTQLWIICRIHNGSSCNLVHQTVDCPQVRYEFDEPDFAMIDTLFSLAEAHLFMQLVELQDSQPELLPPGKTRPDLYRQAMPSLCLSLLIHAPSTCPLDPAPLPFKLSLPFGPPLHLLWRPDCLSVVAPEPICLCLCIDS